MGSDSKPRRTFWPKGYRVKGYPASGRWVVIWTGAGPHDWADYWFDEKPTKEMFAERLRGNAAAAIKRYRMHCVALGIEPKAFD